MGVLKTGFSAIGKLFMLGFLLIAFLAGMAGVVFMSLSGSEIKVPEIVGKDFVESEKELAALGLKIKKRADRVSAEKMNTVLEQLPRPGETVKTGQMILVVVSRAGADGAETPKSLIKDIEEDDTEKIEEMISDKPKKSRSNSNSNANSNTNRKKADTTRDVLSNTSTAGNSAGANTQVRPEDGNKREPGTNPGDRNDRPQQTGPTPKPQASPTVNRSGETRPRSSQRP